MKAREKISVNQQLVDQFNEDYTKCCDNKKMNIKQRGISNDNVFKDKNWLPLHLRSPDMSLLLNPHEIKDLSKLKDKRPLAGKFSPIGEAIFK